MDPDPRFVEEAEDAYWVGYFEGSMSRPRWRLIVFGYAASFVTGLLLGAAVARL